MLSKLPNLLLASPALVGMVTLYSGLAIAVESPWSELNGDSGHMELAACADASDAAAFDCPPDEEAHREEDVQPSIYTSTSVACGDGDA